MKLVQVNPKDYPRVEGESWWVVYPNTGGSKFSIPSRAVTVCTQDFLCFRYGTVYGILDGDKGWVLVTCGDTNYEMPQYLFARYFDAEAFVIGSATPEEMEKAKPFDGKPTLPKKPSESFKD